MIYCLQFRAWVVLALLLACGLVPARAQVGIGVVGNGTMTGTIGTDKGAVAPYICPAGTILHGFFHMDISLNAQGASFTARGMTGQISLYCVSIDVVGGVPQVSDYNGPDPDVVGFRYPDPGAEETGKCPAGQVAVQAGGYDRVTSSTFPWASSLTLRCAPLQTGASDWIQVNTSSIANLAGNPIGDNEGNATHTQRGPFCTVGTYGVVVGVHRQDGGSGYDGVNIYCGQLQQARHSALLTFSDFAWQKTGWLVNLTRNGTLLSNANSSGADKTPHTAAAPNVTTAYQAASELYVLPGSGYGATVSQQPAGIASNTYIMSNTCVSRITLADQQDNSCTLTVIGLPDIGVTVSTPGSADPYTAVGQVKNVTMTATNYGPGASGTGDGFVLQTTLPTGWTATPVTGCTVSGQVVRCTLPALVGAPTPGSSGGTASYTFPVTSDAAVTEGTFQANAMLDRSVADGDAFASNNDYNTANDTASGPLVYVAWPVLTLVKQVVNDNGGTATVADFQLTATGPNATITGISGSAAVTNQVVPPDVYALSEATLPTYTAGSWSCTAGSLSGSNLTLSTSQTATCTIVNDDNAPIIRIQKVLPDGRAVAADQFTLSIEGNNGPASVTTTGSDASVTSSPAALTNAVAGSSYTVSETGASGADLANYISTWQCTNASTVPGAQTPSGTGTSFSVTPALGDDLSCDFNNRFRVADMVVTKTNTPANGASDQDDDTVTSGVPTTYTVVVTNNGPDSVAGVIVRDAPTAELDCPVGNSVTISGEGVPAGTFTIGDLVGPGITLGTLDAGDATTLSFTCNVL